MLHESTQKLILKLHELTLSGAVAWKEGDGDSVVLETEGYQVRLSHSPAAMRLSRVGGRELERADEDELSATRCGDDRTFADVVSEMSREGGRYARGAEQAISRILKAAEAGVLSAGLDDEDDIRDDEPDEDDVEAADAVADAADDEDDASLDAGDESEDDDDYLDDEDDDAPAAMNDEAARLSVAVGDMAARLNQGGQAAAPTPPQYETPVGYIDVPDPDDIEVDAGSDDGAEALDDDGDEPEVPSVPEVEADAQPLGAWPVYENRPAIAQDEAPVEADPPVQSAHSAPPAAQPEMPETESNAENVTFLSPETRPLTEPRQTGDVVPPPPPFPTADNDAEPAAPEYPRLPDVPTAAEPEPESKPFTWGSAAKVTSMGMSFPRQTERLVQGIPADVESRANQRSGDAAAPDSADDDGSDTPDGGPGGTIYKPWG